MIRSGAPANIVSVRKLRKVFASRSVLGIRSTFLKAVNDVSFDIARGEVLGLVGESGSGKSTVGKMVVRLTDATDGTIEFDGEDITRFTRRRLRPLRRRMQMIFQDPFSSLNPKMTVRQIISAPLEIQGLAASRQEADTKVAEALERVGLSRAYAERYPHEFSGGQRQRISIARALVSAPDLLVADEPVSALDVSIQAQVLRILLDIRKDDNLGILFISHDLAVVGHVCDRVAVMYLGRIVEMASTVALFRQPLHPYSEALFSAVPTIEQTAEHKRIILKGDIPSPINPPSGCAFRERCPYATPRCADIVPPLREIAPGRFKACIRDDLSLQAWDGVRRASSTEGLDPPPSTDPLSR